MMYVYILDSSYKVRNYYIYMLRYDNIGGDNEWRKQVWLT